MKKFKMLALVLSLVLALAPISVFAEGEETPKYDMDPAHITFATQADVDAVLYRDDGKDPGKRTQISYADGELKFVALEDDPYVYISLGKLSESIKAEDYPFLAVVYRMPTENSSASNGIQVFCCTDGKMAEVDSVQPSTTTVADGKYHFALMNPGSFNGEIPLVGLEGYEYYKKWEGTVTAIRLDYFIGAPAFPFAAGDTMYVRDIYFFADQNTATKTLTALTDDLNAPDESELIFNVGKYGTAPESQIVKRGETPVRPADPTAEGVIFDGWYTSTSYNTGFDFSKTLTKATVTAYAKWSKAFTVAFDCGEGVEAPATQYVKTNSRATLPEQPRRAGYTFGGWYTDEAFTAEYDFNALVKADLTLRAKWIEGEPEKYTVTVVNGTSSVESAIAGEKVTVTANEAEGKTFDRWEFTGEIGFMNDSDMSGKNASFTFIMGKGNVTLKAFYEGDPTVLVGDVNGDGKLNAKDVTAIMKHLVGATPKNFVEAAADIDANGKVNAKDVTKLMKQLVG
jgi:uncharacterized repeat protein (TIGR02543 family)